MPAPLRAARISASSVRVSFLSGMRRTAIAHLPRRCALAQQAAAFHFEEKLERLNVPPRPSHGLPPSIKPVPAQQNSMRAGIPVKRCAHLRREHNIILRVLEQGALSRVRMRRYAAQSLQNLVSLQRNTGRTMARLVPCRGVIAADQRVPYRVHMEDRAGFGPRSIKHQVQRRLRRGPAIARNHLAVAIDLDQISRLKRALVETGWCD